LGRDSELDLIRIDRCPEPPFFEKSDCKAFENLIKSKLGVENAYDLAVRQYRDKIIQNHNFIIIFVGSCQRKTQITKILLH
jgi:hypothetical protein